MFDLRTINYLNRETKTEEYAEDVGFPLLPCEAEDNDREISARIFHDRPTFGGSKAIARRIALLKREQLSE